jgi:hypothetical protein
MKPKRQSKRLKGRSDLMQLQKMKIAQLIKNLMIAAQELLVMMVTMDMTLVVVPPHLPHKEEVMSDLSLPSRWTSFSLSLHGGPVHTLHPG